MENEWISLRETAELLGVHPATVRAWGDKGELPMQRTPGGHRRFHRAAVEARASAPDRSQISGIQLIVQNMVGRARIELSEGALNDESWYQRLDENARQQLRQIGHRLLQLFSQFLTGEAEPQLIHDEAKAIGQGYERLGRQNGLSLQETTRAYLYFREFLSQTIYDMAETVGTQGPIHWGQIHQKITIITNEVLLAMISAHEETA